MRKFQIPKIPTTTNKSIRFPDDVIAQVEEAIRGTECSFSAFVIEAVRVALEPFTFQRGEAADKEALLALCGHHKVRRGLVIRSSQCRSYPPRL